MKSLGNSEQLVQDAGCGMFQILVAFFTYVLLKHPVSYIMVFMSFGNYNPGWRCLDDDRVNPNSSFGVSNSVSNLTVSNGTSNFASSGYSIQSCAAYKQCERPEFDPEVSTIVTEWQLICDRDWIASLIISVQMIGLLIGSGVTGQLGDVIGRKKTLYACLAATGVLNICAAFSTHWQMFATIRLLIGVSISGVIQLYFTLPNEFLNSVWRARVIGLPAWHTGTIIFSLLAMWSQDWKTLHIIGGSMCLVCCIPAVWVPESMRWLEIQKKRSEFESVVRKVCSMSKNSLKAEDYFDREVELPVVSEEETHPLSQHVEQDIEVTNEPGSKRYTPLDLFRKNYRVYSVLIAIVWMFSSLIYFAITFGVKAMSGSLYINMIILFGMEIPFSVFGIYAPNVLGRQRGSICFSVLTAVFLLVASGLELWAPDHVRYTGTMILAVLGKASTNVAWYCLVSLTSEMYPTCVRSIGLGFAMLCSRVGGALAPLLIPKSADSIYICYIIMGIVSAVSALLVWRLPETKNRKLKETFEDKWD